MRGMFATCRIPTFAAICYTLLYDRYLSALVNKNVYLFDFVEHMHNSLVLEEMYQRYFCFAAQFAPYLGCRCKERGFPMF
jgi:hypothetical protein